MNYKIAKTGLTLCVVYLVIFYILKFIFPEILIQTITHPTLIRLGEVFAKHIWLSYLFMLLTCFITLYLFVSASQGNFKKTKKELLFILIGSIITVLVNAILPSIYTHTSISIMFLLACLCNGKLINASITFVIHGFLSQFLNSIRGFETAIIYINAISGFLITSECLVWLIFLSIIFYFKEEKKNGSVVFTICK